jgi:hypothetical protein
MFMVYTWWVRRVLVVMVWLLVLGGAVGVGAQTAVKLAHAVSTQDPYQFGSERFKELVEKDTGGRLQATLPTPAGSSTGRSARRWPGLWSHSGSRCWPTTSPASG